MSKRTRLSDEYAAKLDGAVKQKVDEVVTRIITRLAEHLWIHYPDASRLLIATDDVTGRAEPVQILSFDGTPLWSVDGPGWEPGGASGPLHSLAPGDAADRHGARIHNDIALLGLLLPEGTQWDTLHSGGAVRSTEPNVDWEIRVPSSTDRLQYLSEVRLDKEARRS